MWNLWRRPQIVLNWFTHRLTYQKEYKDASTLRYGHLMIMADQDFDGSHIKGLVINFLHHFWPSLLKIDGFLKQFITPIVKCSKGTKAEVFYTIPQYLNWKESHDDARGWSAKYYKGLSILPHPVFLLDNSRSAGDSMLSHFLTF